MDGSMGGWRAALPLPPPALAGGRGAGRALVLGAAARQVEQGARGGLTGGQDAAVLGPLHAQRLGLVAAAAVDLQGGVRAQRAADCKRRPGRE
jgi:hypothetical protein